MRRFPCDHKRCALIDGIETVVALSSDGNGLVLGGHDMASGRRRWQRRSTASRITPGVAFSPVVEGRTVVHIAPSTTRPGHDLVEAVDGVTGRVTWEPP